LKVRLEGGLTTRTTEPPRLADEVAALVRAFETGTSRWRATPSDAILTLPGVGLCVPDLTFERDGKKVHLEVMGYWSRDAVWKRIELVQAGLATPIVFAVSKRLRVSEEVLGDDASGALYVYAQVMSARAIEAKLDALAARMA
jgi:predicted nuclease of restriction endonuclease-like RecB superfamily